jgi:hypothetical protein
MFIGAGSGISISMGEGVDMRKISYCVCGHAKEYRYRSRLKGVALSLKVTLVTSRWCVLIRRNTVAPVSSSNIYTGG